MNLEEFDIKDFVSMDKDTKREFVNAGVVMFLEQVETLSILTDEKKSTILSMMLASLEFRIEELKQKEEYELCYFLNEIIWGVNRFIKENTKE